MTQLIPITSYSKSGFVHRVSKEMNNPFDNLYLKVRPQGLSVTESSKGQTFSVVETTTINFPHHSSTFLRSPGPLLLGSPPVVHRDRGLKDGGTEGRWERDGEKGNREEPKKVEEVLVRTLTQIRRPEVEEGGEGSRNSG